MTHVSSSLALSLPEFAPLPTSFVLHLLHETEISFRDHLQRGNAAFLERLHQFSLRVEEARQYAYARFHSIVGEKPISTIPIRAFQAIMAEQIQQKRLQLPHVAQEKSYSVSYVTIGTWAQQGLLRYRPGGEKQEHDLNSYSAILMACRLDMERIQGFMPSRFDRNEPFFWVYAQRPPLYKGRKRIDAPVERLGYPIPANLEPGMIIYSPWPVFDPTFRRFYNLGSMRFAGVHVNATSGQRYWSISKQDLLAWDPSLKKHDIELLDIAIDNQEAIHSYADTALLREVGPRLRDLRKGLV